MNPRGTGNAVHGDAVLTRHGMVFLMLVGLAACAGQGADICEEIDCNDDNECTEDRCDPTDPRVCLFIAVPADSPCDHGGVCSGAGACVDCNRDEQCEDDFGDCTASLCAPDGSCDASAPVRDGTACAGGVCFTGACELTDSVLPCSEQGIRNAIAAGGGPYTFDCDGPTTVTTAAQIVIENDVVLDGEGFLTLDGDGDHGLFHVPEGVTAELRGFALINGIRGIDWNFGTLTIADSIVSGHSKAGIRNFTRLTLIDSTIAENDSSEPGGGIRTDGWLMLEDSTVSNNRASSGAGIYVGSGTAILLNSTVSENRAKLGGGGIYTRQALRLVHSTVASNDAPVGSAVLVAGDGSMTSANSLIEGRCSGEIASVTSLGHNLESPGDRCGFGEESDQANVSEEDVALGALADHGGTTQTHPLLPGSLALDQVPLALCLGPNGEPLAFDQRGQLRPERAGSTCDVGAFERQPDDSM